MLIAPAILAAGCDDPAPTAPTVVNEVITVESFTGTLAVNSASFYSFTLPRSGKISLTLLNLQDGGSPASFTVGIGIGVPRSTGCSLLNNTSTNAGASPQLSNIYDPAIYCAVIYDTGNLTQPVTFGMNISHPK